MSGTAWVSVRESHLTQRAGMKLGDSCADRNDMSRRLYLLSSVVASVTAAVAVGWALGNVLGSVGQGALLFCLICTPFATAFGIGRVAGRSGDEIAGAGALSALACIGLFVAVVAWTIHQHGF